MTNFTPKVLLVIALLFSAQCCLKAQNSNEKNVRPLLQKYYSRLGVELKDVNDGVITDCYTDQGSQLTHVYLQQSYQQIRVFNTIISACFRNNELQYASGEFVPSISTKAGTATPAINVLDAVKAAAKHLNIDMNAPMKISGNLSLQETKYSVTAPTLAKKDIEVTLMWLPSADHSKLSLVWNVNIDMKSASDWWNVRINALTGEYIEKDNWTVHERNDLPLYKNAGHLSKGKSNTKSQTAATFAKPNHTNNLPPSVTSASYYVIPFPIESPNFGSPATVTDPWLNAGLGNNAITEGWHYDGTNSYEITRGNNVFAYLDVDNANSSNAADNWPDTSLTSGSVLSFTQLPDFTQQPDGSTNDVNKKFALNNLFYWNNLMHDVMYQYGFTEISGNYQADNMGRGGSGNDYVLAEAQDGGGTDNANFSAPVDGQSGRMQMYLWNPASITTLHVNAPSTIVGNYSCQEGAFSTANLLQNVGPVTAQVVYYTDATPHLACNATSAGSLTGKIALINRGTCTFVSKIKNAQNAGAVGVIMVNNVGGAPIIMGGTDNTITIPAVMVDQTNGAILAAQLANGLNVTLSGTVPVLFRDGDIDNAVVCHEFTHGISIRLTGGPSNSSCLNGEGWSDYYALMMTTNWATAAVTDGDIQRAMGTYVVSEGADGRGIRRYPYTTDHDINPLTYDSVATNTEVHSIGEVWCATLWDMTWSIIQQTNSITPNLYNSQGTGGNVVALNLVMEGLKLQPCSPGFIDARNAILAADSMLYNNAHKCAIWNAFAGRGMGYTASQGLSSSATDQRAAYDLPSGMSVGKFDIQHVVAGNQLTISHSVKCGCSPLNNTILRDTIPAGFTYVSSSPSGTLSGSVLSYPASSYTAEQSKTFSITLQPSTAGCLIDSVINDNRDGATTGALVSTGTPGWTVSTVHPYSGASSWLAAAPANTSNFALTAPNTAATAIKNISALSFLHSFNTERSFDGGVVEYSTNGTTWTDASALFIKNGYPGGMDGTTTLAGKRAFTGNSQGYIRSILNLATFGTTPVSFRWRMTSNNTVSSEGWYVDDILRENGCGGILKVAQFTSSNSKLDNTSAIIFVLPAGTTVPLTLMWFNATAVGNNVALDWNTTSEINVRNYNIEYSTDGTTWTTIGTVNAKNAATNNYTFIHNGPVAGNNYYRIKMNDMSGRFTYSQVKLIKKGIFNNPSIVLAPNPVAQESTLFLSSDVKASNIHIYDAAGSLVKVLKINTGDQQVKINTAPFANGIYLIEITGGTEKQVIRMMVQH